MDADLTISLDVGSLDISSFISGSHGIIVAGSQLGYPLGVLTLSGDSTFTGGVTLNSGNLAFNGSSLGNPFGGGPLTINGGYLTFTGYTLTIDNPIVLNADFSFLGDVSQLVTIDGPITVANSSAGLLEEGGIIWLNTPLDIQGPTVLGRAVNYFPGGGPAFLTLGTDSDSSGTLLQTSSISLLNGSGLTISNDELINDRVSDTAPITLKTGGIGLVSGHEGSTETIGPVMVSGYSSISAQPGPGRGQPGILTLTSISRVDHGILKLSGQKLGVTAEENHGAIFVTAGGPSLVGGSGAPGTTTISIVPWAVGDYEFQPESEQPNSFATYEPANGFRPLNPATEFVTSLGTNPFENVLLNGTVTNNDAKAVNSLIIGARKPVTLDGTGNVAINSGALLITGDIPVTINNSLSFGSTEAIITCVHIRLAALRPLPLPAASPGPVALPSRDFPACS